VCGGTVSPEILTLWDLHDLDDQVVQIDAALARFPVQRAALAKRKAEEHARLETLKTRLAEHQKVRRDLERDVQALADTEKRFQTQLLAVKKNEEYQALLHEIEDTRRRRSAREPET